MSTAGHVARFAITSLGGLLLAIAGHAVGFLDQPLRLATMVALFAALDSGYYIARDRTAKASAPPVTHGKTAKSPTCG